MVNVDLLIYAGARVQMPWLRSACTQDRADTDEPVGLDREAARHDRQDARHLGREDG
jgi:hypothetical protein